MNCPKCNYPNDSRNKFCQNCGAPLPQVQNERNNKNNGSGSMAIASMILGIAGLILTFIIIGIIPAVIGLILGIVALVTKKPKKGMSITGIVLSVLSILLFIIIMSSIDYSNVSQYDNTSEKIEQTQDDSNANKAKESEKDEAPKEKVEEKQDKSVEEEQKSDKNKQQEDIDNSYGVKVGESFETDGLKVTIDSANLDFQDYDNEYGWNTPEDGMKYIQVSFTFENIGTDDEYVSIYDFDCYADDATCEQVYSLDDSSFMNTNLSPGRNVSFSTYYTVPIDSKSIELEYDSMSLFGTSKEIIKLQ